MKPTTNNAVISSTAPSSETTSSPDSECPSLSTEKMALLGKMIAGIAHEINTPSSAISAASVNAVHHIQMLISAIMALDKLSLSEDDLHRIMKLIQTMASILNNQHRRSSAEMRDEQRRLTNVLEQRDLPDSAELGRQLARMELGEHLDDVLELAETCPLEPLLEVLTHCHRILTSLLDIQISADMLMHNVRALKSYAHPDHDQPELLDVHDTLDVALTILKNQLKHRIHVECQYGEVPLISGYASELSHVWINILHNAIQAMEGEGQIVIETFITSAFLGVKITDNGPGIAQNIKDKIFQRDFTTKPRGEGTGLGLALVDQIITKHGGTITVDSKPGQTTFEVRLPLPIPSP